MLTLVGGVSMWCYAGYRVNPVQRVSDVGLGTRGSRYSEPRRDAAGEDEKPPKTAQDEQTDACPCSDRVDLWR